MQLREIDAHVLDLLVDGESSFAALYCGLSRLWSHTDVGVDEALGVLRQLEGRQLVLARQMEPDGAFRSPVAADYERAKREYGLWLPRAAASEVAVDEIGLWYQITEQGRQAWSQWSGGSGDAGDRWMLDDLADQGILEVRAERKDVAEVVLDRWLAEHDRVQEIAGTRAAVKIHEFVTRDGTRVADGVLVTSRYRSEDTEKR